MPKKNEQTLDDILSTAVGKSGDGEPLRTLTDEHKKMILGLVQNKNQLKLDQEAIRDDTKAIADRLGIKPGDVNRIVSLVMREQEKGGIIRGEENLLGLATQVLGEVDAQ